jgi:hypothetical protein
VGVRVRDLRGAKGYEHAIPRTRYSYTYTYSYTPLSVLGVDGEIGVYEWVYEYGTCVDGRFDDEITVRP